MTGKRKENGFIPLFESVTVLRLEKFAFFFNEKLRLEYLKKKKKTCVCHQPAFEQYGSCKRLNTEHQEEEAL